MKLEVEFISEELIKPFCPTPHHLRRLPLSFLDQILTPICMPAVLFYSKESNYGICNLLKKSLSKALTLFYPLAGRINNNAFVDCNDEGALFVEAQANCQLSDILPNYNPSDSNKLIPLQPLQGENLVAFFQITYFKCGGLSISFCLSHKLGDGSSQFQFLSCWAAITRGDYSDNSSTIPLFGTATLFPPIKLQPWFDKEKLQEKNDKIVTKRFVFDASTIAALQAKFSDEIGYSPSRSVALAGFIWTQFRSAILTNKEDRNCNWVLANSVNIRPRVKPQLSNMHFGNIFTFVPVQVNIKDRQQRSAGPKYNDDARVVSQMSDAIKSVDTEYVKYLQKTDVIFNLRQEEVGKLIRGEVMGFTFTSVCKMPIYSDFGWGKPVFVGSAVLPLKNMVLFWDTKQGGGIEAWINMEEEDMAKLETDKEFLAHLNSSTDPFLLQALKLNANSRL